MQEQLDRLFDIIRPLHEDVEYCIDMIDKADNPFWRRSFIRSVFAELEGVTHCMKQVAYASRFRKDVDFSIPDKIVLLEQTFELNNRGEAKAQPVKIQLTKNIRFAFKSFARACYVSYDLKVDGKGWDSFKKGIKIRDRLTHPKKVEDLTVSDEELKIVLAAYKWFTENFGEVVNRIGESFREKLKDLEGKESINPS